MMGRKLLDIQYLCDLLSVSFYLKSVVRTPNTSMEVKDMEFSL